MARIFTSPVVQFPENAGAELFFYQNGTLTPQPVYTTNSLAIALPNPVEADETGSFPTIFLKNASYTVVAQDALGQVLWSQDDVDGSTTIDGATIADGSIPLSKLDTQSVLPIGAIMPYGGLNTPSGWLVCDGSAVSRTTYAQLYAQIGETWGTGDGLTTFSVPDLRGRAPFGLDNLGGFAAGRLTTAGSGLNGTTLGASGGSEFTQTHTHTVTDPGHVHNLTPNNQTPGGLAAGLANSGGASTTATTYNSASATTGITIAAYGTGTSQNVPPAVVVNYIIKAIGSEYDMALQFGGTSTGTANTYAINVPVAFTSYQAGSLYRFIAHQTNTGSSTLNVNSFGPIALKTSTGATLPSGYITQGAVVDVVYSGGQFLVLSVTNGTVTSVGLTVPSFLTVAGSPITSAGTFSVGAASASGHAAVISPADGSNGPVALRALVGADLPTATTSVQGAVQLADATSARAATDTAKPVAVGTMANHPGVAKAWVNFDGTGTTSTNQTIRASYNVSSVYKNGAGDYTITFATSMQDANYVVTGTAGTASNGGLIDFSYGINSAYTTTSARVRTATNSGFTDVTFAHVVMHGN